MKHVYTTSGEWVAIIEENYLYDTRGDWAGWIEDNKVFTRDGEYAGFLSKDGRILRQRIRETRALRSIPAPSQKKIRPPSSVPLAPMFSELPWNQIDVFDEDPYFFKHISDLKPDWED